MRKATLILSVAFCLSSIPVLAQESDSVQSVQQALQAKGFDPGPIDGQMGPRTRGALRRYQEQNHLKVDGRVDAETASSLGVSSAAAGTEFHGAGENLKNSYSTGGKEIGQGGKSLGHDVKHGNVVAGTKDFGKDVGHGAKDIAVGTGHAAKNAAVGTKDAIMNPKHDTSDTKSTSH